MAGIIPFDFETNAVRVVMRDEVPWFVAADLCRVLEIGNPRDAVSRLDDDERDGVGITDAIGRNQITNVVSESGLYALIFSSRKPAAKRFRKWVTNEVLPAIRRTGQYAMAVSTQTSAVDPFAENATRATHVADHLGALAQINDLVLRVTHLPIWKNGRRPSWWHDIEVREFLTTSHRQMSLLEAERIGAGRFGTRCPKKSSIHTYWQRLDKALGPISLPTPSKKEAA